MNDLQPISDILNEIDRPSARRDDVVPLYAMRIATWSRTDARWAVVNHAIISRWSEYALDWIKKRAWKALD